MSTIREKNIGLKLKELMSTLPQKKQVLFEDFCRFCLQSDRSYLLEKISQCTVSTFWTKTKVYIKRLKKNRYPSIIQLTPNK